jgi:hypothetical protein
MITKSRRSATSHKPENGYGHVFCSDLPLSETIRKKKGNPGLKALWEWEHLEPALRELMAMNNGVFPGRRAFAKIGIDDKRKAEMLSGIMHNGGFLAVRTRLGADLPIKRGEDSLRHFSNLEPIIKSEMGKNGGKFPDQNYMVSIQRYDVIAAINRHHGGFDSVRKVFNAKRDAKIGDEALACSRNFFSKANEIMKKNNGNIPPRDALKKQGYGDFVSTVYRTGGTLDGLREMVGSPPTRKEGKHSLSDWGNMAKEAFKMMESERKKLLPGAGWEGWYGKYACLYAAIKKHGGVNKVREMLGPAGFTKTQVGFFNDRAELQKALLKIIKAQKELPPLEWFVELPQYNLLLQSIYTHHGSLWDVRMRLESAGLTRPIYRHPESQANSINKWENLLPVLQKIVQENQGALPGRIALERQGYYFVMNNIRANGGFEEVRVKLAELGILLPSNP